MKRVRVVAAVLRRGGSILVSRRPDRPEGPGRWEFPGGKVEPGEDEPTALRREIREELACEVDVGRLILRHAHRYPDLHVDLAFYSCALTEGSEPRPVGVAELTWAPIGTLESLDFLEADRTVLADLLRLG